MRPPGPQATVSRGSLSAAVAYAIRALPRSRWPDPADIRVETGDERLAVSASGRELTARSSVPGTDLAPGAVSVDGRHLAAAVKALPGKSDSPATLRPAGDGLTISCHGAEVTVPAAPAQQGRLPGMEMPPLAGTADGTAFARSVARVATAAARDKRYPALRFLLLEMGEESIALSAMDRSRIATDNVPWVPAALPASGHSILVPATSLTLFAAGCRDKMTVHASASGTDRHAGFSDGSRDLIAVAGGEDSPLAGAPLGNHISGGPATLSLIHI